MRTTRRVAAAAAGSLALAFAVTSCAADGGSEELDPDADITQQTLTVSNWADYYPEDLAERFEEATGVKITIVNHTTNEDIVAKLTASSDPGIDVAFMSGQYAQALGEQGILAELDKSLIPNESNLYPEALELAYDPGNVYSEPYAWGTTGLCYRPDLTGYDPTSWNDLLNPQDDLVGKTTMLSTDRWLSMPAMKALGYSLNSTDDAELEEAKAQLIETKGTLLAYDDTTFYAKLVSGEAAMVEAWDGWCNYGIAENPDIQFVVPEEGADLWVDTMTVLESSENKEAAMAFINYILDPEVQTWVAENILYKVPNQAAMDALDPELVEAFPTLGITVDELTEQEVIVDLGDDTVKYVDLNAEVLATN
ncbi:spermidine/putrescine ABC transporter substrate-binding protein [Agromyces rhizosphaerae]|uniref:Spermidine/putrescine ABC transporter substrate-binding protein n=1 Tax=Agromyces rhizosphaerae TaxID=88374 RepID=A0A9W6CQS8_9MICO|nr:spermidine/putrescine ABC transporter substrate-binding protein [Agromyces rhizosphaerae]GLI26818.1 spermidine/putrescine ABC transporter substrate-binding protein [Agromyces rhizosphaerae]